MLRSIFVISVTMAYILLAGPPMLVYSLMTGCTRALYRVGMTGARMALWLAGVRVEVRGREKSPAVEAPVFMPNHQSNVDTPAVIIQLPIELGLAKRSWSR